MIKHTTITIESKSEPEFIDISDQVSDFVKESGVNHGLINVQSMHTSAALLVNENEPLLLKDLATHFDKLSPKTIEYNHDNMTVRTVNVCEGECANGYAHCRAAHLMSNVTMNIIDGKLQLGQWQRILFAELDRPRTRTIQLMIVGE